jgi:hypothetical protein
MLRITYRLGTTPEPLPNTIDLAAPSGAFRSNCDAVRRGPSFVTGEASSLAAGGPQIFLNPVLAFQSEAKARAIASGAKLHQRDSGGT